LIEKLKQLARQPLIHFLLIGAGIYGLYGLFGSVQKDDDERIVTVTAADTQALADQWKRLWSRPPTEGELAGVIRDHVRVQILYREALAMGLDVGDRVIERRLAQKVEFLANGLSTPNEPPDEELKAWYAANPDRFKEPDLYTVTHIFFNPDKRGESTLDDAHSTLDQLNTLAPSNYSESGDRFMLRNHYAKRSELALRKLFGSGFVDQIVKLEPGKWHGPILSGYGTHLVLVNDVIVQQPPAFDLVRAQIMDEWMSEKASELSQRFIDSLVSRYEVVVEEAEVSTTISQRGSSR